MKIHTPILSLIEQAAQDGLREVAKAALRDSNERAPVEDGDLVKSGRVVVDDLTAQVSYSSFYAPLQHENLDWKHPDGGEAKFLERAANAVDVEGIMAERARRVLDG